ncbi:hypothetical protein GQ53DRAFT_853055 [Thozetella sp. PMI_491]|nr:hypothetical protein GQ53DRAFT_853055 [Thozetella sp. PMI_491]
METRSELMGTLHAVEPSPSPTSPTHPPGAKHKRRRNIGPVGDCCRICRARKVRCPGNPGDGPCANCARLELECSFVEDAPGQGSKQQGKVSRTTPSRSHTEAGTVRRRAQRACQNCHIHKTKCSGELPQCKRCDVNGLVCEYMPTKRNFSSVSYTKREPETEGDTLHPAAHDDSAWAIPSAALSDRPSAHDESEVENLTTQDIILRHFHTWFAVVHPTQCYGFFHPATTYREIEEDRFNSILAAGVCAVSGLLRPPSPDGRAFTDRCNLWVKYHLARTAGIFNRQRLMFLVLSSLYDLMVGDWPKVWEYSATAARLVTALQFNWNSAGSSFVEQESTRRLTWQVFLIDRILSGGFDEHTTLSTDKLFLGLPCSDAAFHEDKEAQAEWLTLRSLGSSGPAGSPSLRAICIKLFALRHEILGVTKFAVAPTQRHAQARRPEPSTIIEDINRLQNQLDTIKNSLPEPIQMSDTNIRRHYGSNEWATFVMLHTWIFQLHLDLYRFGLPGIREQAASDVLRYLPQSFLATARFQAVAFAVVVSRFWETSAAFQGTGTGPQQLLTADHALPACVIQSTRILMVAKQYRIFFDLHARSTVPPFRNEAFDDGAIATLIESNMAILEPYYKVMPNVEQMARDLKETVANFRSNTPQAVVENPAVIGMPFAPLAENLHLSHPPHPRYPLEDLHASQMRDEEMTRRASASVADDFLRKNRTSFDYSAAQPDSGDKHIGYALAPPEVPFGLSQVRAANPSPPMVPDLGDPSGAHHPGARQFPELELAPPPEMGSFAQPLLPPQQPAVTHAMSFDAHTSQQMFPGHLTDQHYNLSPQQIDILMNYGDPYAKTEPQPGYHHHLAYQDFRH